MTVKLAALALLVVVAAGCGGNRGTASESRAVLYQGLAVYRPGSTVEHRRISDPAARREGVDLRKQWEHDIRSRAAEAPNEHFANLSSQTFKARLAKAAHDHHFRVVEVRLLRPRQLAPEVVVRTSHYVALAHALPSILSALDPHGGSSDTGGWSYEAFLFEAQDERQVPFLAVFNAWRGSHKGGGQWARSEPLFPFPHG
jgi:hypothetical protein